MAAPRDVDRTRLLGVFDETVDAVFGVCCGLTAGERLRAMDLAANAYSDAAGVAGVTTGGRDDSSPPLVDAIGVDEVVDAVHLAVLADPSPDAGEVQPIASLARRDRVLLSLGAVAQRETAAIAALLGGPVEHVAIEVAGASKRFEALADGEPLDRAFARCGVWLDDAMRADLRSAVASGRGLVVATPGSPEQASSQRAVAPGWRPPADDTPDPFSTTEGFVRPAASRWAVIGVGLAVIAAIATVTVWVLPSNDDQAGPPATFVITPTTSTSPAPTTTEPTSTTDFSYSIDTGDGPPGYLFDPVPDGFAPRGLYSPGSDQTSPEYWFQAWTTPDATRTTGRWLLLSIGDSQGAGLTESRPGSVRIIVGGPNTIVSTDVSGISHMQATIPSASGATGIDVQSFGITQDDLGRVLAGIGADASDGHYPRYSEEAAAVLDTLDLLMSEPSVSPEVIGQVWLGGANSVYGPDHRSDSADPPSATIGVVVAPTRAHDLDLASLLADDVTTIADSNSGLHTADGFLVRGTLQYGPETAVYFVEWRDGDDTVVVVSQDSGVDPLTIAGSARPASVDEWQATSLAASQQLQSSVEQIEGPQLGAFVTVGSGTTADEQQYSIGLVDAIDDENHRIWMNVDITDIGHDGDGSAGFGTTIENPDLAQPLVQFDSATITLLVASFRAEPTFTALRMSVQGNQPVDVPVVQVDADLWAAAFVYSEPRPYVAELVDAEGAVVTTLTNP